MAMIAHQPRDRSLLHLLYILSTFNLLFPLFPSSEKASDEVVYLCRDLLLSELAFKDSIIKLSDKRFSRISIVQYYIRWKCNAMIYFTQYDNQGIHFLVSQLVYYGCVIHHVLIH